MVKRAGTCCNRLEKGVFFSKSEINIVLLPMTVADGYPGALQIKKCKPFTADKLQLTVPVTFRQATEKRMELQHRERLRIQDLVIIKTTASILMRGNPFR